MTYKKKDLEYHFFKFKSTIKKYSINLINIYNINKTEFCIKVIARQVTIIHLTTKNVYLANPNNQKSFITVETVCANGSIIFLMLILKSDVLLEKYFKNDLKNKTLFATLSFGYLNKGLAIKYLIYFHNNTFSKLKKQ